jgi:thiol-disulfide isomerase/thioredoxin
LSEGKIVLAYYNIGYALLRTGRIDEGIAALERYLELDPGTNREAEVRTIIGNPAFANETFAPGFKVYSLEGEELSLERYRGRIVLLDFWATWCGPCRFEMPGVKRMWKKYGGDDFVIIGVNSDRHMGVLRKYLESEGIDWPQYLDEGNKIAALYNVTGIPHTVLIDEFGIVRGVGYRGGKLAGKVGDLVKKLRNKQK